MWALFFSYDNKVTQTCSCVSKDSFGGKGLHYGHTDTDCKLGLVGNCGLETFHPLLEALHQVQNILWRSSFAWVS